jgi:RimJ/RimL family protein N-acetyltransferase
VIRIGERACPVLTTARLTLRPHRPDDFDDMLRTWREPAVVEHFGGVPSTAEEVWARLLRYGGLWPLLGYGYWCARETATGRFAGEVGLAEFRRDITPTLAGAPEAGWVLATWAHGKGYAREATEAMMAWAGAVLEAPRTTCLIHPANAPSLRLAERLGFTRFAQTLHKGRDAILLERRSVARS